MKSKIKKITKKLFCVISGDFSDKNYYAKMDDLGGNFIG
jgi:20S proteasome alpha/beta subunit